MIPPPRRAGLTTSELPSCNFCTATGPQPLALRDTVELLAASKSVMAFPSWLDRTEYPFRQHSMALTDGTVNYVDEGSGEALVFVHGTPTWSFEYRHLIKALAKRYRCIAPDHLGFGLSERPGGFSYSPEAHAAVLREFVDRLGLDRFTLIVHDFGGPIGLPLALDQPSRVTRVIMLNTWAWPLDDDPKMARGARFIGGAVGRFLYRYANASLQLIMPSAYGDRKKLTAAIHAHYLNVFRDRAARVLVLHALAKSLLASRAHYQSLLDRLGALRKVPALIIWGTKDSAFLPYQLERWRSVLPNAIVAAIAGAGHWPHEEEPALVIEEIERFLQ